MEKVLFYLYMVWVAFIALLVALLLFSFIKFIPGVGPMVAPTVDKLHFFLAQYFPGWFQVKSWWVVLLSSLSSYFVSFISSYKEQLITIMIVLLVSSVVVFSSEILDLFTGLYSSLSTSFWDWWDPDWRVKAQLNQQLLDRLPSVSDLPDPGYTPIQMMLPALQVPQNIVFEAELFVPDLEWSPELPTIRNMVFDFSEETLDMIRRLNELLPKKSGSGGEVD